MCTGWCMGTSFITMHTGKSENSKSTFVNELAFDRMKPDVTGDQDIQLRQCHSMMNLLLTLTNLMECYSYVAVGIAYLVSHTQSI
jgi:hypothetical protein